MTITKELPTHARQLASLGTVDGKTTVYVSKEVKGLLLECLSSGTRTWRMRYQVGSGKTRKQRKFKIGDADAIGLAQAERKAREILANVQFNGIDPQAERHALKLNTLSEVVEAWTSAQRTNGKRSWERNRQHYSRHVKAALGSKSVHEITKLDVTVLLTKIANNAGGIAANRTQSLISAALGWAMSEGITEINVERGIKKRAPESARDRELTDDEIRTIWKATHELPSSIGAQVGRVIRLLLLTGQRRTEVCQMARSELRGKVWRLPAARAKNKIEHDVPLTRPALQELRAAMDECEWSPFVFQARLRKPKPMHDTTPSAAFADMMKLLKIDDVRLHDLRHVVATEMARMRIPADIRQQVMNQVTGRKQMIGSRYDQHDYMPEKRRALRLWAIRLNDIVGSKVRRRPLRWQ